MIEVIMPQTTFGALNSDRQSRLANAIVDTIREPLIVLDQELRAVVASRSFYRIFDISQAHIQGIKIYDLNDGVLNVPELQLLLEKIIPEHGVMEDFEVDREFPRIGHRTMLLNARKVFYEEDGHTTILLSFEDVTDRRKAERMLQDVLAHKDMLLSEMSHRVANSLQIIASILLMKARNVDSPETKLHLQDAHRRVMSIASVQQHLQASGKGDQIDVGSYLTTLCKTLSDSMIGDNQTVSLEVVADDGTTTSNEAVSVGLIVTELVINALKHAFPDNAVQGRIVVGFEADGQDWKLSISDNGIGMPERAPAEKKAGLGTSLVKALAQQLEAQVETATGPKGTTVSITHATFISRLPTAA
jgi:chemotaxis protein methyltransferase CheR